MSWPSPRKKWKDMTFDEKVVARDRGKEIEGDPDVASMRRWCRDEKKTRRESAIRDIINKRRNQ